MARTLLTQLREETRDVHQRAEESRVMKAMLAQPFCRTAYQTALARFYRVYCYYEPALCRALATYNDAYAYTPKTPLLQQDLTREGCSIAPAWHRQNAVACLEETTDLLSAVYVLEGATLGGQVIHRMLLTQGVIDTPQVQHFFNPYASECRANWQKTCAFIESTALQHGVEPQAIIASARTTFTYIEGALQ